MRVLGVDHGERRIGLAICDALELAARPVSVVAVKNTEQAVRAVADAVAEQEAEHVVVGLPLNMDGSEGSQAALARGFSDALRAALEVPVEMADERLTSAYADDVMLAADLSRARRKKLRDAIAAQMMLQAWLDRRRSGG